MSTGPVPPQYDPLSGPPSTTARLIRRAQSGERRALDELFTRLVPRLTRWARGRLPASARDRADTEDVVQDVMTSTLRRLDNFEPRRRKALHAYLKRGIRNRILDFVRQAPTRGPQLDEGRVAASDSDSPERVAMGHENWERYCIAVQLLAPADRELIIGRIELGYSYDQLAIATGRRSADSARMAVRRALLRLAEQISDPPEG